MDGVADFVARKRLPPAVVVAVGCVNGLAAIRSLGRLGVPVVAVHDSRDAIGFRSRYAFRVVCPHPADDEDAFVEALAELGGALGPHTVPIFPTADAHLNAIARNRARLEGAFRFPFADWETLERVQSKRFQLERAQELGIPVPRTWAAPSPDVRFPVVVKPSQSTGFFREFGRKGFVCESRADLDEAFERALPYDPLVQEWVPGGDRELVQFGTYLDESGRALAVFACRKLRQTHSDLGTCRVGEAMWDDELAEQSLAIARGLGCVGFAEAEFKRDARDAKLKLIEVNPRLWQWHGLAAASGVDFTAIAYRHLVGHEPVPAAAGPERRWAITFLVGSGHDRGLHPLRPAIPKPPYVDAVFAADDLRPALAQGRRIAAAGAAWVGRRIRAAAVDHVPAADGR